MRVTAAKCYSTVTIANYVRQALIDQLNPVYILMIAADLPAVPSAPVIVNINRTSFTVEVPHVSNVASWIVQVIWYYIPFTEANL